MSLAFKKNPPVLYCCHSEPTRPCVIEPARGPQLRVSPASSGPPPFLSVLPQDKLLFPRYFLWLWSLAGTVLTAWRTLLPWQGATPIHTHPLHSLQSVVSFTVLALIQVGPLLHFLPMFQTRLNSVGIHETLFDWRDKCISKYIPKEIGSALDSVLCALGRRDCGKASVSPLWSRWKWGDWIYLNNKMLSFKKR